ncbi:YeeE/YedE family protein [Rhodoferax sp.]|uniref:YeeE/YedE family protein n=1 Tax=Rhodoferax sp. TaxID=50421 RepID=UPI00260491AF|nr:YeeE/YedE family protein [Rhodoferax sp.]MDD2919520.1 YeeE/YedE family protein [Rhodoferax sp.]
MPLVAGLATLLLVAVRLGADGWRQVALWLTGLVLGVALYHASFGFANAYRRMLLARDMRGVQAQLLLLALTTLCFAPVFANGTAFGQVLGGAWAPVGVSVAVGAFMFGIGMQIAGGCGSGTLYTAGGGSLRMMLVLVSACAGSFWASLHMGWWQQLPSKDAIVLADLLGWRMALALQLGIFGLLSFLLWRLARPVAPVPRPATNESTTSAVLARVFSGPWPVMVAAVVLALGNVSTLLLAGHPWSITWGFTLWGAKVAGWLGWRPAPDGFWQGDFQSGALAGGVLDDTTSMMDLAIMLGALCAASLAGRFAPRWDFPWRSLLAALLGGLLLGYGSRIAYGCNIGAFVSGVASGSLHGWLWITAALPGTWLGIRLRRRFGMAD